LSGSDEARFVLTTTPRAISINSTDYSLSETEPYKRSIILPSFWAAIVQEDEP